MHDMDRRESALQGRFITLSRNRIRLGSQLKRLRMLADIDGDEMAKECKVCRSTVYNWENKGNIPGDQLIRYANYLGLEVKIT